VINFTRLRTRRKVPKNYFVCTRILKGGVEILRYDVCYMEIALSLIFLERTAFYRNYDITSILSDILVLAIKLESKIFSASFLLWFWLHEMLQIFLFWIWNVGKIWNCINFLFLKFSWLPENPYLLILHPPVAQNLSYTYFCPVFCINLASL
jgi:hypothetical protein